MKILDVDLFQDGLKRNIAMLDRLESEIEAIQRTVEGLVGMEDELKGEGGNAIRAFYAECHLPLLQYFLVSAAGYKQVLQQMENALYALEPDTSGHIVEQFLEGEVEQGLTTIAQLTENLTIESNSIMDQVSDIVALPHLNDSGVQESVLNAKRKRDDTVGRLQDFDATQTAALLPFEQDMDAMDTWIQNMEEMFNSNLTDIDFQQNHWEKLTSRNRFQSDLIIHTTSIAGISNKLSKESQLNLMFKTFMSSTNPIRFGYGGLIHRPIILFGPETLAFARLSSAQSDRQEKVNDTNIVDEELKVIYTELAKHPDFGNYRSDTLVDPLTGEYLHTFEGMRKVVGGNGSGTPDGLAPIGMFAFDFYTEDLVTMFGPDSTVNERLAAALFTFGKPIKIADTGLDLLKSGEKAKNTGKGTVNNRQIDFTRGFDVDPKYSSYEQRVKTSPVNKGEWSNERAESLFISDKTGEIKKYLDEAGVDGVEYKNGMPDFSPFSKGEIKLENMTNDRKSNFSTADEELAKKWSTPEQKWTAEDIADWREDNKYTWHELNDLETIQLVPSKINSVFKHLGGVGEYNIKVKLGE
ncbi:T7SS effector LXG polymorphic toxin [Psychrobacillus psychrodurans]|uniref:T7SS effector LXG polymorphic toxin n=1 Tax=Psychrobacillus psychrodurans TaxID=126157 RepID=UPI0008E9B686|nr:T7SS effector LXG polymorphic toxin [Psychrobacillus psychrodurans]MCZ8540665.1 T7SS effector LXG polymorphic toxin [Psychrobacillus psychrodurans]SFM72691.1 DNase/tRNase domain of colicin-like bacteriocin [Psychrobacillus psychrodurans]